MDLATYNKKIERIKELRSSLSNLLIVSNTELRTIENLLRQFPTVKISKFLKISQKETISLKSALKQLYVSNQNQGEEFKKLLSLLDYSLRIEEHRINEDKLITEAEEFNKANLTNYDEELKAKKLEKKQTSQREKKEQQNYHLGIIRNFKQKHSNLLEKFIELVNRRISILDEYGDPSWESLYIEIAKFITKMAISEGIHFTNHHIGLYKRTRNPDVFRNPYNHIAQYLEQEFKKQFDPSKHLLLKSSELNDFSGLEFEAYVAQLLEEAGATDISGTPITGDQGADLLFKIGNIKIAAQVKRRTLPIGNYAIQEVVGSLKYYDVNEGWVITNVSFTSSAKSLAQKNGISLIDGSRLKNLKEYMKALPNYFKINKSQRV